ncbi:MAG: undecaprenyl-diphosphatase UppP [Candidatus Pacebacteria bacterium]|nr:undecaprenyl-diphosphatase UppP [Candidatus Paceibacterota bacterium]MBP9842626.1 undecaprenyl-diphosphatase UppP [Candidatus Paceibacterota bacterium]
MDIFDSVVLGLVQGITEFLPISSSGHLILVRDLLSIDATNALAYDAVLHLSTTLAVIVYFRNDLWVLIQAMLRKLGRLPVNQKDLTLFYALAIGTVPAVILGVALEPFFDKNTQSTGLVALMLFMASVFFMYVEWRYYLRPTHGTVTAKRGFLVGLFQALALLPGFSRSGATIAGGMMLGMSRYEASRFSFLLAIPITLGVGCKKSIDLLQNGGSVDWGVILIGAGVAAVTAFIVIHFFLAFIRRYTLWPFIWYSVILSALVGYVSLIS